MSHTLASSICCTASLLAGAALAQSPAKAPPSTTVAPVTVQGATPKAITTQSLAFVQSKATAANPEIGQISRWHAPVCVQVEGLAQAAQADLVKARIESVAQSVGLPTPWGGANCTANVEIVFTDNPQGVMNVVAKEHEDFLGYYHRRDRDRLKTVSHPIQAWYKTSTSGEGNNGGMATATYLDTFGKPKYSPDYPGRTGGNATIDDPGNKTPTGCGDAPHFTACLTSQFENVFIVADSKALGGKGVGLGLAAEYMVMLALSQPKALDGCAPLTSVLDVMAKSACPGRDPPGGLTPADSAWLTALYASDAEAKGDGARSEIANRMADILIKANSESGASAAGGR